MKLGMRPRMVWLASATLFGIVPAAIVIAHVSDTVLTGTVGWDFGTYYDAANLLVRDGTPYDEFDEALLGRGKEYVYPPLTAIAVSPFTLLPPTVAGVLAIFVLVAAVLATPLAVGVRDWRCLGIVLLWPPVIVGIQTANVTILIGLAAALAWRVRAHAPSAGVTIGIAFAVKFLLWPLGVWLLATRRFAAAAWAVGSGVGLLFASWAAIGFAGFDRYVDVLQRVSQTFGDHGYSLFAVVLQASGSKDAAIVASLALATALLWGVAVAGRRGMDRRAFILAVAASLSVTPIIWLEHYAWLIVVVAVARPRLGPIWFVPLAMWLTAGTHSPTEFERVATIAVAALTVFLSVRVPETALESQPERSVHAIQARAA